MNKLSRILGILILTIIVSCQYDHYAHKYTTIEPKESELVGIYVFNKQTVNYDITEFRDSTNNLVVPKIIICSDGSYEVKNLPVFESSGTSYTGLITTNGKWKIMSVGSIDDGSGNLKTHWGIFMPELPINLRYAGLMNSISPYGIIWGIGDPDEGRIIMFEKE